MRGGGTRSTDHVPALDGVRGVAILAVLFVHASWMPTQTRVDAAVTAVLNCGWMGVDLFFVLSGYLITGILIDTRGGTSYFRSFYARRALRILPLYYAFVICFVVVLPIVHHPTPVLQALVAHQAWLWTHTVNIWAARDGISALPYAVGVAWSLSVEEQFYVVWPLIVWLVRREALRWVCVTCIVGAFLLRLAIAGRWPDAAYALMPARMDALALGGLIATTIRDPDGAGRLRRLGIPVGAAALGMIVLMYLVRGNMRTPDFSLGTVGYAAADWLAAAIVIYAVTRPARLLTSRLLRFFGRYSYAFYLLHLPVMIALTPLAAKLIAQPLPWGSRLPWMAVWMVLAIGTTTVLALLSWCCLEHPFLTLKRYFPLSVGAGPGDAMEGPSASDAGVMAAPSLAT